MPSEGTTVRVRPARPEEFAAVGVLTAAAYRADGLLDADDHHPANPAYEEKLLDAAGRAREAELWVAAADGAVLGTVTWCPPGSPWRELSRTEHQAEFRMLAVAPAGRRRGLARALVEACPDRARRDAMAEVVIWSHPRMLGAHALYARLGFERAHDLDGSPVPGVHLWGFRLTLSPPTLCRQNP